MVNYGAGITLLFESFSGRLLSILVLINASDSDMVHGIELRHDRNREEDEVQDGRRRLPVILIRRNQEDHDRYCREDATIQRALTTVIDLLPKRVLVVTTLILSQLEGSAFHPMEEDEGDLRTRGNNANQPVITSISHLLWARSVRTMA